MRLPRDISGSELASCLRRYSYEITRQTGSHIRLTSSAKGHAHHVTVPAHKSLKVGTLAAILGEVAAYLEMDKADLAESLFGRS